MLRNNDDLYMLVRELCRILSDLGGQELSEDLRDALSISSLPGEVLGEILLSLKRVRAHSIYAQCSVQGRVDEGIEYVRRVLGVK